MTRFACTREGAAELVTVANQLRFALFQINDASERLTRRVNSLIANGRIPQDYTNVVTTVISQCVKTTATTGESVEILAEELIRLSDSIMQIVADWDTAGGQKIIGGVSKDSIDKSAPVEGVDMDGASLVYVDMLGSRFKQLDRDIRALFERRGWKCCVADAKVQGGAYYDPFEDGVYLNQTDDLSCPLGAGNRFFHEIAHQIDHQSGEGKLSPLSYTLGMAAAAKEDYRQAIQSICDTEGCTIEEAESIMRDRLYAAGNAANCVSDVFGGVTGNRVTGFWGHGSSYWEGPESDCRLATEAFAEMLADRACSNDDNLAYTKTYMPRAYGIFEQMIKELAYGGV